MSASRSEAVGIVDRNRRAYIRSSRLAPFFKRVLRLIALHEIE
jgi:hypothetical protein